MNCSLRKKVLTDEEWLKRHAHGEITVKKAPVQPPGYTIMVRVCSKCKAQHYFIKKESKDNGNTKI